MTREQMIDRAVRWATSAAERRAVLADVDIIDNDFFIASDVSASRIRHIRATFRRLAHGYA